MKQTDGKPAVYLGIDVAKEKMDVLLLVDQRSSSRVFANRAAGCEQLSDWLQKEQIEQVHACLEATGSYSDAIALYLLERGHTVSVLNPAVLVNYRKSRNTRSKTDQLDSMLLAYSAQERHPLAWHPLPKEIVTLRSLLAYRDDVQKQLLQTRNRQRSGRMELWVAERVQAHIGEIERFAHAGSLVSLAGLAVKQRESGSSVHGRAQMDRHGRRTLRQFLYMCALVAMRWDPHMRAWAQQLKARGKPTKVVLIAVMRKLLHIIYGVWKNASDYDAQIAFPALA